MKNQSQQNKAPASLVVQARQIHHQNRSAHLVKKAEKIQKECQKTKSDNG